MKTGSGPSYQVLKYIHIAGTWWKPRAYDEPMEDKENIDPIQLAVSQVTELPSPVAPINNNNIDLPALATLITILKVDNVDPQLGVTVKPTLISSCDVLDQPAFNQLNGHANATLCGDSVQDSALDMHGKPASKSKTGNWKACFLIFGKNNLV
jgi:hypothetical protein